MHNYFEIEKNSFGTTINYERGYGFNGRSLSEEDDWQEVLNRTINSVNQKSSTEFSKDDLSAVFAQNSDSYVMKNFTQSLENLKDLNGNAINFNDLNPSQQYLVFSFLQEPLELTQIYGTRAYLSDIKIDINNDELYIEANIHTIDGQTLSTAAKFETMQMDTQKYQYGFGFENLPNQNQIHRFSFVSAKNLSTDERKQMIESIKSANLKDLDEFEANIEISMYPNDFMENGLKSYAYENFNLELDYEKAIQNAQALPKEEEENKEVSNSSSTSLLSLYWTKFQADLGKLKDFNSTKINAENSIIKQKDSTMLLKSLLKVI